MSIVLCLVVQSLHGDLRSKFRHIEQPNLLTVLMNFTGNHFISQNIPSKLLFTVESDAIHSVYIPIILKVDDYRRTYLAKHADAQARRRNYNYISSYVTSRTVKSALRIYGNLLSGIDIISTYKSNDYFQHLKECNLTLFKL